MKKDFALTQEHFDNLLSWLSPNRKQAGDKYEEIRTGLIRFFRIKGCSNPEILADETINRVAAKVHTFNFDKGVKTITYFYGFAAKIFLEYLAQTRRREVQLEPNLRLEVKHVVYFADSHEQNYDCLDDCLAKLSLDESKLIITYYGEEKSAKFELRKKLAENLNLKPGALHTKIHRIRNVLKKCVEQCLKKNDL